MMTLLEILKEFARRNGLPVPSLVFSSQDDGMLQLAGVANEVVEDLITNRGVWTELQKEATWVLTAVEDQGSLDTLAPYGFKWMIKDTFWDRTQGLPVTGPVSPTEWQMIKGSVSANPYLRYRMRGKRLLLTGTLTAGHSMAFEYASDFSVLAANGTTYKKLFTADDDTFVLNETLLFAGLNWMWRRKKGFAYSEEFRTYELLCASLKGHDGTKPDLQMDGVETGVRPGIFVPTGDWNLP
jgi:hypothetical protein